MFKTADFCEAYLDFLVAREVISYEDSLRVHDEQQARTPLIGRVALSQGLMTARDIARVLDLQIDSGLLFGDQARAVGLISQEHLDLLLDAQRASRPGVGELLLEMGCVGAAELAACRAEFLEQLEALLV